MLSKIITETFLYKTQALDKISVSTFNYICTQSFYICN